MASILKVNKLQHTNGTDALTVASDGSATIGQISSSSVFPAGHVLQVVNATLSNVVAQETAQTSETVVANATNQITITPGNKVFILAQCEFVGVGNSNCNVVARLREGTDTTGTVLSDVGFMNNNTSATFHVPHMLSALDESPASTTPDYTLTMLKGSGGTSNVQLYNQGSQYIKITLMEIKG